MNEIPAHIKAKVNDIDWNKTFIFEEIPIHVHTTSFERVQCSSCKYRERELGIEELLTKIKSNESVTSKGIVRTLSSITIIRGTFDDCIGIQKEYN